MELLSALAVATSVAQFLDFAGKVLRGSFEIGTSSSGQLYQHKSLSQIAKDLEDLSAALDPNAPDGQAALTADGRSSNDVKIQNLCKECHGVANQLLVLLNKLRGREDGKRTSWDNLRRAPRSVWDADRIQNLKSQLEAYRQELAYGSRI